jgi:Zn-dependent protease
MNRAPMPTRQGSFRLFRIGGFDVFLHWSWFLVAYYEITYGGLGHYQSRAYSVLEYLSLFLIVVLHEFGHALACRSVGGEANQIVLWPLGGVAYVAPPPRPGATLWTIAAGPLVNVALIPIIYAITIVARKSGLVEAHPDLLIYFFALRWINRGLLFFNLLPVYPLDGGQILRSLLWFPFGRARSLLISSVVGFAGVIVLFVCALFGESIWLGIVCIFLLMQCWTGLVRARGMARVADAPRRAGAACPSCRAAPPMGEFWKCPRCRHTFDMFSAPGVCPICNAQFSGTPCFECGRSSPLKDWLPSSSTTIDI